VFARLDCIATSANIAEKAFLNKAFKFMQSIILKAISMSNVHPGVAITNQPKTPQIPLNPEGIVDIALGLTLYFSRDEQERKFGEDVKDKWDALAKEYREDPIGSRYLQNVDAALSATVYHMAQLRQTRSDQFKFWDDLKDRRIKDLDDLVNLSKDAQSIAARLVGLSMGGGITFLQLASNVLGPHEIFYVIVGAGAAYIVSEILLRVYKSLNAPRILEQTQMQKELILKNQVQPKLDKLLTELLEKVNKISKELYVTKYEKPRDLRDLSQKLSVIYTSGSFVTGSSGSDWIGPERHLPPLP